MSWGQVYQARWTKLSHLFSWTPLQIQALTVDEFIDAIEYLKGVETNAG